MRHSASGTGALSDLRPVSGQPFHRDRFPVGQLPAKNLSKAALSQDVVRVEVVSRLDDLLEREFPRRSGHRRIAGLALVSKRTDRKHVGCRQGDNE